MARTTALALIAAMLCAVVLVTATAAPATATETTHSIVAQGSDERTAANRYAGTDGQSPLEDVPVVPMVAITSGILATLSVIAFRRGWI